LEHHGHAGCVLRLCLFHPRHDVSREYSRGKYGKYRWPPVWLV
jgi:hypothetical protein